MPQHGEAAFFEFHTAEIPAETRRTRLLLTTLTAFKLDGAPSPVDATPYANEVNIFERALRQLAIVPRYAACCNRTHTAICVCATKQHRCSQRPLLAVIEFINKR